MHIIAILLIALLSASPVVAANPPSPLSKGASTTSAEEHIRVAALSREAYLAKALELPESELFSQEETPADAVDFELKLPEEELPLSDIPLAFNSKVEYFLRYFQTTARPAFGRWLSRSERYIPMMKQVLKEESLPEDLVYLAMIESGFTPHAVSVANAVGPWQFMSATGKRYALRIDHWIDERRDPLKSTVAAAMYLKELYALFNKDWYLAAAGYNAGENKILRAINMYNSRDFWQLSEGSYLKRETREYVPKLLAAAIIAKDPVRFGFADVAYLPPIEFDTVVIPSRTDLELVARICEIPYDTIRDLNPELRRGCTPPDYKNYELKIPKGKKSLFEAEYTNIPESKRYTEQIRYARYRSHKKETLAEVARRFRTTSKVIADLNHLGNSKKLHGRVLIVPVQTVASSGGVQARSEQTARREQGFTKYYTVKRGDTLTSLAKRFNVSAGILSAWNNLKGKMALNPGKRLIVAKYVEKKGALTAADESS